MRVPRARLQDEETGEMKEFRSEVLPRYARRTREVDEAILATYLSGANSHRIRKALKPLLGEERKYRESSCLRQFCTSIQLHRTCVIPIETAISAQIGRGYQGFRGYVEGNDAIAAGCACLRSRALG